MSLFAKDCHGEPLRLNFSSGSGFVEISSSDDKTQALWQTVPYKSNSFGEDDVNSYLTSAKKAFQLVNQKNNCAVAFVDGMPEFVKKPGHPFKAKVLNEFPLTTDWRLNVPSERIFYDSKEESSQDGGEISGCGSKAPHVNIMIDKVTVTILHEISDAKSKIPILCTSVNDICVIGLINSSKFRIICSFTFAMQYMEALRSIWLVLN